MAAIVEHAHSEYHVRIRSAPYVRRRSSASQKGQPEPDQMNSRMVTHAPAHYRASYSGVAHQRCATYSLVESEAEPSIWAVDSRAVAAWEKEQEQRDAYSASTSTPSAACASYFSTPSTMPSNSPNTYYRECETTADAAFCQYYNNSSGGGTTCSNAYNYSQAQHNETMTTLSRPSSRQQYREQYNNLYQRQISNRHTLVESFPSSDLAPDWLDETDNNSYRNSINPHQPSSSAAIMHHPPHPIEHSTRRPPRIASSGMRSTGFYISSLSAPELRHTSDRRRVFTGPCHVPTALPISRYPSSSHHEAADEYGSAAGDVRNTARLPPSVHSSTNTPGLHTCRRTSCPASSLGATSSLNYSGSKGPGPASCTLN